MSKFHSMVSRRDFMKGLALAGVGTAALTAPAFHDLDELVSSSKSLAKRPWYVKERDLFNPTVEVDWGVQSRYDARLTGQAAYCKAYYYGKDRVLNSAAVGTAARNERIAAKEPGYTMRSRARCIAAQDVPRSWTGVPLTGTSLAVQGGYGSWPPKTPEQRGEPKWTGTPEEASDLLRAAMRNYGVAIFGFGEMDSQTRNKVVNKSQRGNANGNDYITNWPPPPTSDKVIVYEDVDKGYDTTTKIVIPTKNMYWVCADLPGAKANYQATPSMMRNGRQGHDSLRLLFYGSMTYFMTYLGYQWLGTMEDGKDVFPDSATGILGGCVERSRQDNLSLSPEYAFAQSMWTFITDLPVAPTKPIDAGMWRFCASCGKCADICPSSSISFDRQPSWELPTIEGKPNILHNKGTKSFFINGASCGLYIAEIGHYCTQCIGTCSFMVGNGASIHSVLKPIIANTSVLNSFAYNMSKQFGYGLMNSPEDWWDRSLPVLGIDSMVVANDRASY